MSSGATRRRAAASFAVRAREQIGVRPGLAAREVAYRARRRLRLALLGLAYERLTAVRGAAFAPLAIELEQAPSASAADPGGGAARAVAFADRILAEGEPIDWHRDPGSAHVWPRADYREVRKLPAPPGADPKGVWERSRGHDLLALARAARITGEPRYLEGLTARWRCWLQDNPAGVGINWANPMEVAIRAVSWSWALSTLGKSIRLPEPLGDEVVAALERHLRHLIWNPEGTPRLRGNHFFADAVGIFVLTLTLRTPGAPRWQRRSRRWLMREADVQILPDGTGFEASTGYQGLVIEMLAIAAGAARLAGGPLPGALEQRLAASVEASLELRHPGGRMPQFGDCDDGRLLPVDERREPRHDAQLAIAAAAIGSPTAPGDAPDPAAAGAEAQLAFGARPPAGPATAPARPGASLALLDGGLYVLRGGETHFVLRCGGVGQNGNGGHAHNDLLSFELSVGGVPFVVDPGTYAYLGDREARNRFRGTAAHSTIEVGGEEANPIDPDRLFGLSGFARPRLERWRPAAGGGELVASHDGYRRLDPPLIHRRAVRLDGDGRSLAIDDLLEPEDPGADDAIGAVARIQLAPDVVVSRPESEVAGEARLELARQGRLLELRVSEPARLAAGEVSCRFGSRVAAKRIEVELRGRPPLRLSWRLVVLR